MIISGRALVPCLALCAAMAIMPVAAQAASFHHHHRHHARLVAAHHRHRAPRAEADTVPVIHVHPGASAAPYAVPTRG